MSGLDLSKASEAFRDAQGEGADDEDALRYALPHILDALAASFGDRAYRGRLSISSRLRWDASNWQVTASTLRAEASRLRD